MGTIQITSLFSFIIFFVTENHSSRESSFYCLLLNQGLLFPLCKSLVSLSLLLFHFIQLFLFLILLPCPAKLPQYQKTQHEQRSPKNTDRDDNRVFLNIDICTLLRRAAQIVQFGTAPCYTVIRPRTLEKILSGKRAIDIALYQFHALVVIATSRYAVAIPVTSTTQRHIHYYKKL